MAPSSPADKTSKPALSEGASPERRRCCVSKLLRRAKHSGEHVPAVVGPEKYAAKDKHADHLVEVYKMYLEMADRISARRQAANNFFLTINTALVAMYAILDKAGATPGAVRAWQYAVPAAGLLICLIWGALLRSYRSLNSAKFKVIHELEAHLPARPFDAEWALLKEGKTWKHIPFTALERWVPMLFACLYLLLCAVGFRLIDMPTGEPAHNRAGPAAKTSRGDHGRRDAGHANDHRRGGHASPAQRRVAPSTGPSRRRADAAGDSHDSITVRGRSDGKGASVH